MKKSFIAFLSLLIFLLSMNGIIRSQISTFPYVQTGELPIGWNVIQSTPIWNFGTAVMNPAGKTDDAAVVCNFYAYVPGPEGIVVSPAFNFTQLHNPVLHFYTAHTSYDFENDSIQFLVSTDAGNTFIDVPTPYRRSFNSSPSLSTVPTRHSQYNPSSVNDWRHETINLAQYAGMNNITIGIRGVCYFGNNFWVDNFIVTDADNYCQQNVTAAGDYSCSVATVTFNSIGMTGANNNAGNNSDNPSGGVISFSQHYLQNIVPSLANPEISVNSSAATNDGSVFTPNRISSESWFTISYSGNDINGYANYNISFDVSGFSGFLDPDKIYILKRADLTGSWQCLNTVRSGSVLTAVNLSTFSDFALGGDSLQNPLPVELSSFTSSVYNRNVSLYWTTSSERNNSGFTIERLTSSLLPAYEKWDFAGFVNGNGTSEIPVDYSFTDKNLNPGTYKYRIKQNDFNGNFEYYYLQSDVNIGMPQGISLSQNYPNPFNPITNIDFAIFDLGQVSLKIYDVIGNEVNTLVNETKTAGSYSVKFNGENLPSGVYYYKLVVNSLHEAGQSNQPGFTSVKKMLLIK
ncbi:MAG TPA: T9SS type A sorting domain-containing protein [Ignavibacteria bacterium]|nr:T9SS type A sorting domain-containing protein [Ignavibacteria bacterium]